MAYLLLATLLLLCVFVGIMLPVQTLFQAQASIWLPLPVLVTKVVSFCVLATFASYFLWCLVKDIDGSKPVH
ncbi:MAG: hypothetical protein EOO15_04915 [Chitinophagaceae bacterium]|nr:MAG: hypothetical protein EOO15_04915 [Chitinophagaceae bacterium]